jgi:hypothetical protein
VYTKYKKIFVTNFSTQFYHKENLHLNLQLAIFWDMSSDTGSILHAKYLYFGAHLSRNIVDTIECYTDGKASCKKNIQVFAYGCN